MARLNIRNNNNNNAVANNNTTGDSMALPIDNVQAEHQSALEETQTYTIKCIPAYRSMIKKFIQWLKDNYPDHYDALVFELSSEQKANTRVYPKSTHDLRYNLLSPDVVKLFICATKINPKNKLHYGFDTLRKYHDAILYCSKLADVPLPPEYKPKMKAFLDTIKKETTKAKSEGKTKEQDADPIQFPLYIFICNWAVKSGAIMVWAFTVMQWNCMGRSINIDPLGFRNLSCKEAEDSIAVHYDANKRDQKGELTSAKNCYANPFNPAICMFLALGCYLCMMVQMFDSATDKIFRKSGKDRSAADTYCKTLRKLIEGVSSRVEKVLEFCREGHFHPHGTRKGAAMMVTTGTMEPPSMPSVLLRGEWSLGKVLDIYWRWSKLGDTYLGRLLAGLDPDNEEQFATLPPHFIQGMENEYIREGMMLCFSNIINAWGNTGIINVLLLLLASIVYHSEWLYQSTNGNSQHPFNSIPVLQQPELLNKLKQLVTLEPAGTIRKASGVPSHIKQFAKMKKCFETVENGIDRLLAANEAIPEVIKAAIDEAARDNGQVTSSRVMELMQQHTNTMQSTIAQTVKDAVQEATRNLVSLGTSNQQSSTTTTSAAMGGIEIGMFREYSGNAVPLGFKFPSADLRTAWRMYLLGLPSLKSTKTGTSELYHTPVRPFRYINSTRHLPRGQLRRSFNDEWRPVLEYMFNAAKTHINGKREEEMNAEFLEVTFVTATESLESKYSTLFTGDRRKINTRKISTWNRKFRQAQKAAKKAQA